MASSLSASQRVVGYNDELAGEGSAKLSGEWPLPLLHPYANSDVFTDVHISSSSRSGRHYVTSLINRWSCGDARRQTVGLGSVPILVGFL